VAQYKALNTDLSQGSCVYTSVDGTFSGAQYSFVEADVEVKNKIKHMQNTPTHATRATRIDNC
jgi:hypothetical protein